MNGGVCDKTVCHSCAVTVSHKRADSIDSISIQTAHITTVTSLLAREMDAERERDATTR